MGRYIVRRVLWMIPVLFFISIVTFALAHAVPGGPFDREKPLPAEIVANLNKHYGLDQPLWKQYTDYMGFTRNPSGEFAGLLQGNFGPSYASRGRTVNDIFAAHLPVSATLGLAALAIGVGMGVPLGVIAALKQNTIWDYLTMGVAIFGVSVPNIVLGPLFILVFALTLGWFPVAGWGRPEQLVMPAIALGLHESAIIARLTRASMLQVIREDYIRTARSKGLSERMVMVRHALKNAFIPVATILGPMFAALLTGTFVVEQIFAIPGLGKYFVTSITNRDYPVVMGTVLLYAVFLVIANLLVDLTYAFLDPRIKFT
ncbi:MAG TPA: ABC transporter permease [Chloroflexi bacterium]|jgi:ABC-type dipeptide/oligopeptide/nickel transport system permease component|nr:ABC transporter permease [Chloroflexota bacterium]